MPPKKPAAEYMQEWRIYKVLHGSVPCEQPGTADYSLAHRIRKARRRGVFNSEEMAELDAEKPSKGDCSSLDTGRPAKKSKSKNECPLTTTGQHVEEALAASGQDSGVRPQARSPGKRSTPDCEGSAEIAPFLKANKRAKNSDVSIREGLFFDPQQGAWCGMHALNNFLLNGRMVEQQDCRDAARLVCSHLSQAREGDEEPISNRLDPATGRLSIDATPLPSQPHASSLSTP